MVLLNHFYPSWEPLLKTNYRNHISTLSWGTLLWTEVSTFHTKVVCVMGPCTHLTAACPFQCLIMSIMNGETRQVEIRYHCPQCSPQADFWVVEGNTFMDWGFLFSHQKGYVCYGTLHPFDSSLSIPMFHHESKGGCTMCTRIYGR